MSDDAVKLGQLQRYETTVDQMFSMAVKTWPDRLFVVGEQRKFTYAEMDQVVDVVAHGLQSLGVAKGDRVAVWMSNVWEWIALQFAVTRIGAVLTPLNTRLRIDDLRQTLRDSGASVLVTQEMSHEFSYVDIARAILRDPDQVPALKHVVVARARSAFEVPFLSWEEFIDGASKDTRALFPETDPTALAYILYTSGTTSIPKGVMLSHVSLNNAFNLISNLQDGEVAFLAGPLFAIMGCQNIVLSMVLLGGSVVLLERFDPEAAVSLIEAHRATLISGIMNVLIDISKVPSFDVGRVASLRTAHVFPKRLEHLELLRKFGFKKAATAYGMTETGGPVTNNADLDVDQMDNEGICWPGDEVRIVGNDGSELGADKEGHILVRSPHQMMGYFNRPDATAAMVDAEGWMHTGDFGVMDARGRLKWVGRHSDMFKCNGFNVASLEVEAFLQRHPAISEVAVVGVADQVKGEVGAAFVVGANGHQVDMRMIREFCSDRIASYKVPGHVIQLPQLPRTASGKVRKVELKAMVQSASKPSESAA